MKLRSLLVVAVLFLASHVLRAQVGLYVNPIAIRVSNSTADTGTFAFLGTGVTSRFFWGVNLGGYYDFAHYPKVAVGIDIRDSILHANNAGLNNFLVGLRISRPASFRLRPYIQPFAGLGSSRAPETTIRVSKPEFGVNVGLDYALNRHIDFRALEVGYGNLVTASSGTVSNNGSIASSTLIYFSSGFVIRIP